MKDERRVTKDEWRGVWFSWRFGGEVRLLFWMAFYPLKICFMVLTQLSLN